MFKGQKGRDLHDVTDPDPDLGMSASALPKQDRRDRCVQEIGGGWKKVGVSRA